MSRSSAPWDVDFNARARRDFNRVPTRIAEAAVGRCELLAENPHRLGEALRFDLDGFWSTRIVGSPYRMLYMIDEDQRRVTVVALGLHRKVYRRRG